MYQQRKCIVFRWLALQTRSFDGRVSVRRGLSCSDGTNVEPYTGLCTTLPQRSSML